MDGEDYLYLDFKFNSYTIEDQKPYDLKMPLSASAENVKVLKVRLKDNEHKMTLTQTYAIFDDVSAIVRSSELTNDGNFSVQISKIMSGALELPDADYELWHLCGAWLKEDHVKSRILPRVTSALVPCAVRQVISTIPLRHWLKREPGLTTASSMRQT